MANIIKCRGFVLNTMPFKESSLIASVLTNNLGKVKLLAKGIRRPRSKMCGAMERFNFDELIYYKRDFKEIYTLSDAVVIDSYSEIRGDPYKVSAAVVLCEFYDRTLPAEAPDRASFSELTRFLKGLKKTGRTGVRALVVGHLCRALSGSGVMPHLNDCVRCHRPAGGGNGRLDFSVMAGGVVCDKHHDDTVIGLSQQTVKTLVNLYRGAPLELSDNAVREIESFMVDYMHLHLNNLNLRSLKHFK
ncbi:DNA repair protein RecO [candidate division WOR-3 bacterium]|nr:DNA repair protein RecO [candidate division WOR-3 bacterium]